MTPLDYAAQICYSSREVLQFSYDMGLKYKDVPGIYCECGVAAGAQVIAMAYAAPNKTIYAFDSFQGVPLPSNKDNQMPGIKFLTEAEQRALPNPGEQLLETTGATSVSYNDFWDHVKNSGVDTSHIWGVEGWFEETLPLFVKDVFLKDGGISILRLDGDLYNSTYVCLKYLYPKVIKGGLVIIDDWALPGCRQAVMDYFEHNPLHVLSIRLEFIEDKNSTVAYWIK